MKPKTYLVEVGFLDGDGINWTAQIMDTKFTVVYILIT